jgi:hypothetical protein
MMIDAGKDMDLVKINETMNNFEKVFGDLDVNNETMSKAMDNVTAGTYEEKDVNNLIGQIAEEFSLKVGNEFDDITYKNKNIKQKETNNNLQKQKAQVVVGENKL